MEGPGTRDAPREVASLLPALPVSRREARIPRPRQVLVRRPRSAASFNRLSWVAAGVRVGVFSPVPGTFLRFAQRQVIPWG